MTTDVPMRVDVNSFDLDGQPVSNAQPDRIFDTLLDVTHHALAAQLT